MRYVRKPNYDKRVVAGAEYNGDAWLDSWTNIIHWCVVGYTMNFIDERNDYIANTIEQEFEMYVN